ncbi:hypothetical protein RSJ42_14180 [Methanosarcina hadiensis]|uniref:hypothetical protein n=1 Tax=Methanosarcina hadiensis TaxID=3078083 RepID=UPI00397753D9
MLKWSAMIMLLSRIADTTPIQKYMFITGMPYPLGISKPGASEFISDIISPALPPESFPSKY